MTLLLLGLAVLGLGAVLAWHLKPSHLIESPISPMRGVLSSSLRQTYVLNTRGQIYGFGPHAPSAISTAGRPVWNSIYLSQTHSWAIDLDGKLWSRPLFPKPRHSATAGHPLKIGKSPNF